MGQWAESTRPACYDPCPVLRAEGGPDQIANHLFRCDLIARTLHQGTSLPRIRTPEQR